MFNWLMCHYDSSHPRASLRKLVHDVHRRARRSRGSTSSSRTASGSTRTSSGSSSCTGWCARARRSSRRRSSPRTSAGTPCSRTSCSCSTRRTRRARTPSAWWATSSIERARDREVRAGTASPRRRAREVRGRARRARGGGHRRVSERRLALFANPAAAGGRALDALPAVEGELTHLGVQYRVVNTLSVEHARDEARTAAENGETVVAVGGDGLVGSLAGALRGGVGELAIVPSGRGNDFARVLKIPAEPREAARVAVDGAERDARRRARERAPVRGHREPRLRLGREPDRERGQAGEGQPRLPLRRAARARRLEARALPRDGRRTRARGRRLLGGGGQLEGVRRRDVRVPAREARRRAARRR